jgi:hypothetical protein
MNIPTLIALTLLPLAGWAGERTLEERFHNPPHEAKPWVFWYWIKGNVSQVGVDADLNAMAKAGISGAHLMHIGDSFSPPFGSLQYMTPEYCDIIQHTLERAAELNIKINLYNCEGWSASGGPWVSPEESMQCLVWTETRAAGEGPFQGKLPRPHATRNYYRDEAVVAFPTPAAELRRMRDVQFRLASPGGGELAAAADGDWGTTALVKAEKPGKEPALDFVFEEPFTARSLTLIAPGSVVKSMELQSSSDGKAWTTVAKGEVNHAPGGMPAFADLTFPSVTARQFRLKMKAGGQARIYDVELSGGARVADWTPKACHILDYRPQIQRTKLPEPEEPEACIQPGSILDLTSKMKPDGSLDWNVPAGDWTILRFGMTTTGMENRPSGPGGRGLETDKFSKAATKTHFDNMLGKIADRAGALTGPTLMGTHVDSWEVGTQNWSPAFAQEFEARRGYSPRTLLPAMTGRIIGEPVYTERFLWDIRRTVADLLAENYFGALRDECNRRGMKLSVQAMRPPIDYLQCAGYADIPIANVQLGRKYDAKSFLGAKGHSSAGHLYGRKVISSESLTARPEDDRYNTHPFIYKPYNDLDFTGGVNHQALHVFVHEPQRDKVVPGMTLNQWGCHLEPSNTWWEQAKPWLQYLQRAQFVLQQGDFAADVLYFQGDDIVNNPLDVKWLKSRGYDYDLCNPEVILNSLSVNERGEIVSSTGLRYKLLALLDRAWMRPEVLAKIRQLVNDGATVLGTRPSFSPSLNSYPACDAEVNRLASDLWKEGASSVSLGKGRMLTGIQVDAALRQMNVAPDFQWKKSAGPENIGWIHRRIDGMEVFFVANHELVAASGTATFRVSGRKPELWHPETGRRSLISDSKQSDDVTEIPLDLNPAESVFVVFPEKPTTGSAKISNLKFEISNPLPGPWHVSFQPNRGAPDTIDLANLADLTGHPDDGVKFFSGTAAYSTQFEISNLKSQMHLDLGQVHEIAEVRLNGKDLGILWKPPFRVEITDAVKAGKNTLEIKVTNLWPNRMIGDERMYPPDAKFMTKAGYAGGGLAEWPEWLLNNQPRPIGRIAFSTWKHWDAKDELLPSGLIGPVRFVTAEK